MAYRSDLFTEVVKQLNGGRTLNELSEQMNALVQSCRDTLKKGELTLKITIAPDKGGNGQYFLTEEIKVKEPVFERGKTLTFGTPEGNLQRTDPNQGQLDLRVVTEKAEPARVVDETPKEVRTV